jgi:hypothetical protein
MGTISAPKTLEELERLVSSVLPDVMVVTDSKTLEVVIRSGRYLLNGGSNLVSRAEATNSDDLLLAGFQRLQVSEGSKAVGLRSGKIVTVISAMRVEGDKVRFLVQHGRRQLVLFGSYARLSNASFRLHNGSPLQWVRVIRAP